MNERIRELAEQAWQYADNNSRDGDGTHGWLYRDKFAELIIQECANVANENVKLGSPYCGQFVKKYFGVE